MLICRVFDVLYFAVFQQCKIKTAKHSVGNARIDAVADTFGKTFTVFFGVPFQKHFVELAAFVFGYRLERGYNFYAVFFFSISLYITLSRRFLANLSNIYTIMYLNAFVCASDTIF